MFVNVAENFEFGGQLAFFYLCVSVIIKVLSLHSPKEKFHEYINNRLILTDILQMSFSIKINHTNGYSRTC